MQISPTKLTRIKQRLLPIGEPTRSQIIEFIDRHERFKGCYFWTPPTSASSRRQMETQNSMMIDFEHCGSKYHVSQSVTCSCKNVYYSATINVNDINKNIRALKNLIGA